LGPFLHHSFPSWDFKAIVFYKVGLLILDPNPLHLRCEALALMRHAYLRSFALGPKDVGSLGAFWNFSKRTGLPWVGHEVTRHKEPIKKAYMHRTKKIRNPLPFHSILYL
jgi:hypothetical protein